MMSYVVYFCHSLVVYYFQVVLCYWLFILIKTTAEVMLAGNYKSFVNCDFSNYFDFLCLMAMGVIFVTISMVTFVCYVNIFYKINKENKKREQLGKDLFIL